jgi:hypothetical protein
MPWELDGIMDLSILHEANEYGRVSNDVDENARDLSAKESFAL